MLAKPNTAPVHQDYRIIDCKTAPHFDAKRWDNIAPLKAKPTIAHCVQAAAEVFGVSVGELKSDGRYRYQVRPRHAAMYLARCLTDASLPQIARHIGNRDHNSVVYALERVQKHLRGNDLDYRLKIKTARKRAKELANKQALQNAL